MTRTRDAIRLPADTAAGGRDDNTTIGIIRRGTALSGRGAMIRRKGQARSCPVVRLKFRRLLEADPKELPMVQRGNADYGLPSNRIRGTFDSSRVDLDSPEK